MSTTLPFSTETGLRILAAACDLAVIRSLELVGKKVSRSERARYGAMVRSGKPWHEAHTMWRPTEDQINAALAGAWSTLPRLNGTHGCCNISDPELAVVLDSYVRGLVASGTPHNFVTLQERLKEFFGGDA